MASPSLAWFEHKVVVGIADMAISNNPGITLTTYSLGSCIGVSIYDPVARVGGMLHAMLPESAIDPVKAAKNPAMFIDTGVPTLFRAAYELKADKRRLIVNVAGGAQIMDSSGFFNIGKRNYETLVSLLSHNGVTISASEIGGMVNRTMHLELATGRVTLKVSGQQQEVAL